MTMAAEMMMRDFVPSADNTRLLRDAFGRFATGVTIVTTMTENGPIAITANSFSSLSLNPPLVLWAPDRNSRRFVHFEAAQRYAIHVLADTQQELCWRIARNAFGLTDRDFVTSDQGIPVLTDCLACFHCEQRSVFDGGDHAIVVGEVKHASFDDSRHALGFFGGQMGTFVPQQ